MIEAGMGFVRGADHTFGMTPEKEVSFTVLHDDVRDLYKAMRSAVHGGER